MSHSKSIQDLVQERTLFAIYPASSVSAAFWWNIWSIAYEYEPDVQGKYLTDAMKDTPFQRVTARLICVRQLPR